MRCPEISASPPRARLCLQEGRWGGAGLQTGERLRRLCGSHWARWCHGNKRLQRTGYTWARRRGTRETSKEGGLCRNLADRMASRWCRQDRDRVAAEVGQRWAARRANGQQRVELPPGYLEELKNTKGIGGKGGLGGWRSPPGLVMARGRMSAILRSGCDLEQRAAPPRGSEVQLRLRS